MLQGHLDVFVEDESGKRLTTRLGPWECIACPAGVIHGYQNDRSRRFTCRSCSAAAGPIPWAIPTVSSTSAGMRT